MHGMSCSGHLSICRCCSRDRFMINTGSALSLLQVISVSARAPASGAGEFASLTGT